MSEAEAKLLEELNREEARLREIEAKIHTTRTWLREAATLIRTGKSARYARYWLSESGDTVSDDNTVSTKELIKCC